MLVTELPRSRRTTSWQPHPNVVLFDVRVARALLQASIESSEVLSLSEKRAHKSAERRCRNKDSSPDGNPLLINDRCSAPCLLGLWLLGSTKVYSDVGADILMESISPIDPGEFSSTLGYRNEFAG
jgi:hypothetical protein